MQTLLYKLPLCEQNIACDPAWKSPSMCPRYCFLSLDLFAVFAWGLLRCFMNINTLLYLIKARAASVKSPSILFTFKMNLKADIIFKILSEEKWETEHFPVEWIKLQNISFWRAKRNFWNKCKAPCPAYATDNYQQDREGKDDKMGKLERMHIRIMLIQGWVHVRISHLDEAWRKQCGWNLCWTGRSCVRG